MNAGMNAQRAKCAASCQARHVSPRNLAELLTTAHVYARFAARRSSEGVMPDVFSQDSSRMIVR
jgi:hypothetical protein